MFSLEETESFDKNEILLPDIDYPWLLEYSWILGITNILLLIGLICLTGRVSLKVFLTTVIPIFVFSIFSLTLGFASFIQGTPSDDGYGGKNDWNQKVSEKLYYQVSIDELSEISLMRYAYENEDKTFELGCEMDENGILVSRSLELKGNHLKYMTFDECSNNGSIKDSMSLDDMFTYKPSLAEYYSKLDVDGKALFDETVKKNGAKK